MTARLVRTIVGVVALALAAAGHAGEPGAGVKARLVPTSILRGGFEQTKQLNGFRNPLRSRGDFVLARDRGVIWRTVEPFAGTIVVRRDRIISDAGGGKGATTIVSPASSVVSKLLLGLISGDVGALSEQFTLVETLRPDGTWQLRLEPRSAGMKRVFSSIQLQGDGHVRRVVMDEASGDHTEIRFLDLEADARPLSADEEAQLD